MKKFLSLLLAVVMVLSMVPAVFAAEEVSFTDVEAGKYYEIPVMWAVNAGVTKGTGDGTTFSPSNDCTRKQVVTFLWRAAGSPEPTTKENPFPDVTKGDQFEKAILWAAESNITKGYKDGTFKPEDTCTRKQVVTFLHRYNGTPAHNVAENPFPDVTKGDQFENAILWAYENGITQGNKAGNFQPEKTCTRGDIVTFLFRSIVNAPVEIASEAALSTITVYPANTATYLVNGRLSGNNIEIEAVEGVTVTVNGKEVKAENGKFVALLDGAPVNTIEVKNETKAVVELDAAIVAVETPEETKPEETKPEETKPVETEPVEQAISINAAGELSFIDVKANDSVEYAINGRLSGQYLTIAAAEGVTVTVGGKEVKAENGKFVALLDGAPTTSVVVTNNTKKDVSLIASIDYAEGTEGNPIEITDSGDFGIDVAAESETYYAIASQLNGQVLTVVAKDGITVTVNGTAVEAKDGLFTAELNGAPVNKVVVANAGDKAAETTANIGYAEGTEGNPIAINAAGEFTVVVAAEGKTAYAVNSQLNGYALIIEAAEDVTVTANGNEVGAVDGVYTVMLDAAPVNAVVVANAGKEAVELKAVVAAEGETVHNPLVITNSGDFGIDVAANGACYIAVPGMLNGQVLTVAAKDGITVTVNGEAVEAKDGLFTAELNKAPMNQIVVSNAGAEAAALTANINFPAGSLNNPIVVNNAADLTSVKVAANGETYIAVNSQLNGMNVVVVGDENTTVTVNGTAVEAEDGVFTAVLNAYPMNQVVVSNAGAEDVELVAALEWPLGSKQNPIVINNAADLTSVKVAANGETYIAVNSQLNGMNLIVVGDEDTAVIVNDVPVEGKTGIFTAEMNAVGPMNQVVVSHSCDEDTELVAALEWPLGSEQNPITINNAADLTSVEVAAGKSVYYAVSSHLNGMVMNVAYNENITVTANGEELWAWEEPFEAPLNAVGPMNQVVVTNNGTEDLELIANIDWPLGSEQNPFVVNSAEDLSYAEAFVGKTYYMISSMLNGSYLNLGAVEGITYELNGTELTGANAGSYSVELTGAPTNRLVITNTLEYTEYATASIGEKMGTENNHYVLNDLSVATAATVGAGETVYFDAYGAYDMIMTVKNAAGLTVNVLGTDYVAEEDTLVIEIPAAVGPMGRMPVTVIVSNANEAPSSIEMSFSYKPGHMDNPAELVLGENTAVCAEGGWGYYYTWTAPATGTLELTMPEGNWSFTINNLTTWQYGEMQSSDAETVVNTVDVAKGDELQIVVNTYDPENPWASPAGNIVFTASFDELTAADIVEMAYALGEGEALEGTYTLTGTINSVDTVYNEKFGNVTVTILVDGIENAGNFPIQCYRLKGEGADVITKGDIITVTGTLKNYNGTIEFDAGCTLDSYTITEKEEVEVPAGAVTYTFSKFKSDAAATEGEEKALDENVTVAISKGYFADQLRIYQGANAIITSQKGISSIVLNAGYKNNTFNVYTSEDGETWTLVKEAVAYTVAYTDITIEFETAVKYIKIDAPNAQIRVNTMTVLFA